MLDPFVKIYDNKIKSNLAYALLKLKARNKPIKLDLREISCPYSLDILQHIRINPEESGELTPNQIIPEGSGELTPIRPGPEITAALRSKIAEFKKSITFKRFK